MEGTPYEASDRIIDQYRTGVLRLAELIAPPGCQDGSKWSARAMKERASIHDAYNYVHVGVTT